MTLFFETFHQALCFLTAIVPGMVIAAGLSFGKSTGVFRVIADVGILILSGGVYIALTVFVRDTSLRMYHLLGALCGAILYLRGIDRTLRSVKRWILVKRKTEKEWMDAGMCADENENISY